MGKPQPGVNFIFERFWRGRTSMYVFPRRSPFETRSRTAVERLSARTATSFVTSLDEEARNDSIMQCKECVIGRCTGKSNSLPVKNDTVIISCQLTRGELQVVERAVVHTFKCKCYEVPACFRCFLGAHHHLSTQPCCRGSHTYL